MYKLQASARGRGILIVVVEIVIDECDY